MFWRTFLEEKIDFMLNRRTLESFISWCTKLKVDHRVVRKWEITTLVYSFSNNKVKEVCFYWIRLWQIIPDFAAIMIIARESIVKV
jgi:hypothetical protein